MRWQSMATTWMQVLPATNINRAGNFLPCGMDMGYLRRPGNLCPPLYNQIGVSTPSFASTLLRTTRDSYQLVLRSVPAEEEKLISLCLSIYSQPPRTSNLPGAVSTLVQIGLCTCVRAVVTVAPHCIAGQDR